MLSIVELTVVVSSMSTLHNNVSWSTMYNGQLGVPTTLSRQAGWSMTPAHFRETTGRKGEKIMVTIVLDIVTRVAPAIQPHCS